MATKYQRRSNGFAVHHSTCAAPSCLIMVRMTYRPKKLHTPMPTMADRVRGAARVSLVAVQAPKPKLHCRGEGKIVSNYSTQLRTSNAWGGGAYLFRSFSHASTTTNKCTPAHLMAVGRSSVATMDRNAMPEDTREHHVTLSIKEAPYLAGSSQPRWQGRGWGHRD